MLVEDYFAQFQNVIQNCLAVQLSRVSFEKRSTHEGFIHGELTFVDASVLHFREYVDVQKTVERLMYTYQYQSAANDLIFRYDNTGHHRKRHISTYLHHKHDGSEENVIASPGPDLAEVIAKIQQIVMIP